MIYTVTFNPSIDYIVTVEDFKEGFVNRTSEELMFPGGKGINVSMVLSNLGFENTALGFLAGIFVSSFIIIALYLLNNTISSEDDVEKYLGLNNLGIIPIEEGSVEQMMRDKKKRKKRQKQKAGVKHE